MKENVAQLVEKILNSRKNANKLTDLINLIQVNKNELKTLSAIEGAVNIFKKFSEREEVLFGSLQRENELTKVNQYKLWVGEKYQNCCDNVLDSLLKASPPNQDNILRCYMQLLSVKCSFMVLSQSSENEVKLCEEDMLKFLNRLLPIENTSLLELFIALLKNHDVRYLVLKLIPVLVSNVSKANGITEQLMENVFNLLKQIVKFMPRGSTCLNNSLLLSSEASYMLLESERKGSPFIAAQQRKVFSKAWLVFLKLPFSTALHKEILMILHSSLIPNFSNPRLLSDFLVRSFAQGGGLALLGLHGLFVLVHEHNLEYPDFYKNLYSLLHPRIFDKKYKGRFFHLMELFLSSTHIPSYVVAAFIKKMARLTLYAPPHGILIILSLINFLIKLHSSVTEMMDDKNSKLYLEDPFVEAEEDLLLCNALKSSLWEIDTLENHYLPEISEAASAIKKLKVAQPDMDELYDIGYKEFLDFDEDLFSSNAVNHVAPTGIIGGFEDITAELWQL